MTKKYDRVPIIDIECTCYPNNAFPKGEKQEIIEIGVALLNSKYLDIEEVESILVPPTQSLISDYCTQLTTLTPDMFYTEVDHEHKLWTFREACQYLESKYFTRECPWMSWGDFDRLTFEKQCADYGVQYPFSRTHFNLKTLFSLFLGRHKGYGMKKALRVAGLPHKGTHHRGHDDAYNIARIASWLFRHRRDKTGECNG